MSKESERLMKLDKKRLVSMFIESNHLLDLMSEGNSATAELVSLVQNCAEAGCDICGTHHTPTTCEDGRAKGCTNVRTLVAFETPPDTDPIHVCGVCAEAYYQSASD